jgi:hypothetical protein
LKPTLSDQCRRFSMPRWVRIAWLSTAAVRVEAAEVGAQFSAGGVADPALGLDQREVLEALPDAI